MLLPHHARMFAYDRWANQRVIDSLRSAQTALERDPGGAAAEAPAFVKARQVWAHVQWARRLWHSRLIGAPPPDTADRFPPWPLDRAASECLALDQAWGDAIRGLDEPGLRRVVAYRTTEGHTAASTVADILAHVVNHSTYHRGQIARLVAECGGEVAVTDFIAFARHHPAPGDSPP
jgi:uncharacterized damage-inducible protein DinB